MQLIWTVLGAANPNNNMHYALWMYYLVNVADIRVIVESVVTSGMTSYHLGLAVSRSSNEYSSQFGPSIKDPSLHLEII